MKVEKKQLRIEPHRSRRARKRRGMRIAKAILLITVLSSGALAAYFTYTILNSSSSPSFPEPTMQFKPENANPKFRAAIVDQLSLTYPNQTFIEAAVNTLEQAGYTVDYYAGENVTVGFYRDLPVQDYNVIILRVHSTCDLLSGSSTTETSVCLFSSELVSSSKYVSEQFTCALVGVYFLPRHEGDSEYFGISNVFVRDNVNGRFNNTLIVMMGCEGLTNTLMADAFLARGAMACIGWNGPVLQAQTDATTTTLLDHLFVERQTIVSALKQTYSELGADPEYKSIMIYYPESAANQIIQSK